MHADSNVVLQGVMVRPGTARLVGPPKSLTGIDSVVTDPISIPGDTGPFSRTVAIETSSLGVARIVPTEVLVSGEVAAVMQRSFPGVVVTTSASGFAGFTLDRERVVVQVQGPAHRVEALTRDSLRVIAHLVGHAGPDAYARLSVGALPGITARAVPDSVGLKPPAVKPTPAAKPAPTTSRRHRQEEREPWLTSSSASRRRATRRPPPCW